VGLLRRTRANTADTASATVDVTAVGLPAGWRIGVARAPDHHDEVTAAAEVASPNAPTRVVTSNVDEVPLGWFPGALVPQNNEHGQRAVTVDCAGVNQVGGIPPRLHADACRRGPSTE
jgi:hypothetical protein